MVILQDIKRFVQDMVILQGSFILSKNSYLAGSCRFLSRNGFLARFIQELLSCKILCKNVYHARSCKILFLKMVILQDLAKNIILKILKDEGVYCNIIICNPRVMNTIDPKNFEPPNGGQ